VPAEENGTSGATRGGGINVPLGLKGSTGAGVKSLGGSGEPKVVIVPVVVPPCGLVKEYDWNPPPRFVIAPV